MTDDKNLVEESESNEASPIKSDESSHYKDGDTLTFIKVRFPGHVTAQEFFIGNKGYTYGQKVVAMSDRGMALGYINSFAYSKTFKKEMLPLKKIARIATEEDILQDQEQHKTRKRAEITFMNLASRYQLEMTLTHVEYTQFGKNIIFYFTSPNRVDFRDLLVDLRREFKLRIELRQITIRDRSAAMGGIGSCGRALCCSTFLEEPGNSNIKMCKNQDIAIIPNKINGPCGQVKCCMRYENDTYTDKRDHLPREGALVHAVNGDKGKVIRLHVLKEQFEMMTERGFLRRYALDQFNRKNTLPQDWRFPTDFDVIDDQRAKLVTSVPEPEPFIAPPYQPDGDQEEEDFDDSVEDSDEYEEESGEEAEERRENRPLAPSQQTNEAAPQGTKTHNQPPNRNPNSNQNSRRRSFHSRNRNNRNNSSSGQGSRGPNNS